MTNMKLIVSTVLIFALFGYVPKVEAKRLSSKYQKVSSILARVKQTDGLPNTVHKNPLVLKAVGLFLEAAGTDNLPEDELYDKFRMLFPLPEWKEWVPGMEIKKVKSSLYLVSIGYAAVTQESSLYLFSGTSHLIIDSGTCGIIHIEKVDIMASQIAVTYLRTPGSTRPDYITATINKEGGIWQVRSKRNINAQQLHQP